MRHYGTETLQLKVQVCTTPCIRILKFFHGLQTGTVNFHEITSSLVVAGQWLVGTLMKLGELYLEWYG